MNSTPETAEAESQQTLETRVKLLAATWKLLARDGYAGLSTREIAAEAGVNHALVHYYFGTKDRLVIAALDEANSGLIARQERMYAAPGGFAEKWAMARAFYEEDLASGFVRVQLELWAAAISNPTLREDVKPRLLEWRRVVHGAVREALTAYRAELPFSSDVIATWIVGFWAGIEFAMLVGITEEEGHFRESLQAMQDLLARLDREAGLTNSTAGEAEQPV
jgi:AcrR family transcriptional regulator